MKTSFRKLEQAIGYRFRKKELLQLAVTHPSFRYENEDAEDDNQRLEYLGDAVLGLVVAEHLFKTYPEAREGDLSQIRSRLTQDRKLAEIGASIELGEYILLGRGEQMNGGATRASNLADAVEALLGAAWLDGGARAVLKIFRRVFLPELEKIRIGQRKGNPKGNLQEYAQSNGHDIPEYTLLETTGPEHDRRFTVEVTACGQQWQASARSKREAERRAAVLALETLLP